MGKGVKSWHVECLIINSNSGRVLIPQWDLLFQFSFTGDLTEEDIPVRVVHDPAEFEMLLEFKS